MYIPSYFKIENDEIIYDIIEENGFATFFSQHEGEPFATHIPLMIDKDMEYLYGHFSRANPQWKDIKNQNVLAVFHGPHCYISSSWYESNQAVPTWNYLAVHVYGKVEIVGDGELIESLSDLVKKYEMPDSSYQLDEVDPKYLDGMTKGVVGFKIKIEKIEGKAKLSQNHSIERRKLVIQELEKFEKEDERKIASYMKNHLQKDQLKK
ncbi:FMN-binding negative transcriptional regulator [Cytobacillus depressus]|uniref:FMN-binding negative transcriptional regulator n=1 Tax=Cytobacillus depressus TaxID=1602942 RepID=A0A6L3V479_9BACI|nr:FMN-binding negative transcriptional regulator [Cytobacillus depressus]KAB2329518.1 FMN-binding negative transcriptional regulator [Cytobacillus depressus]